MGKALAVTDSTFAQEVLQSKQPVLVDFWADWCGPCKAIAPVVEELAGAYEGQLKVLKLDVDENPRTASAYRVQSIPTLLVFKDGKPAERIVGAVPKKSPTGDSTEPVDTRVLQVLYSFNRDTLPVYAGQQMDVFTAAG
ncbi:MAG: thioredoxin [Nitrospinae bacterium]|nr:thioredoxin [Nitrospinota bacterium]